MQYTNNTDRTTALYYAVMLNNASANLASAIRRAADTRTIASPTRYCSGEAARTIAKIAPKGRTIYRVNRSI